VFQTICFCSYVSLRKSSLSAMAGFCHPESTGATSAAWKVRSVPVACSLTKTLSSRGLCQTTWQTAFCQVVVAVAEIQRTILPVRGPGKGWLAALFSYFMRFLAARHF
jgi:hypothetical protein